VSRYVVAESRERTILGVVADEVGACGVWKEEGSGIFEDGNGLRIVRFGATAPRGRNLWSTPGMRSTSFALYEPR
jgi:hypothetical protein